MTKACLPPARRRSSSSASVSRFSADSLMAPFPRLASFAHGRRRFAVRSRSPAAALTRIRSRWPVSVADAGQPTVMPSPPAASATVTEPISVSEPAGVHGELVDDAVPAGLDVDETPAGRGTGVYGAGIGCGLAQELELAACVGGVAADRGAAGVRGEEQAASGRDPARGGLPGACWVEQGHGAVRGGRVRGQRVK